MKRYTTTEIENAYRQWDADPTPDATANVIRVTDSWSMGYAVRRMRRVKTAAISEDDLFQVARQGVCYALGHYNPDMGRTFASYAIMCIRGWTFAYLLYNTGAVKYKVSRARRKLFGNYTRAASEVVTAGMSDCERQAAVAEALNVTVDDVAEYEIERTASASLDAEVSGDAWGDALGTLIHSHDINPERLAAAQRALRRMHESLSSVSDKYRPFAENLLAGSPRTRTELAGVLGLTRERGRQITEMMRSHLMDAAGEVL